MPLWTYQVHNLVDGQIYKGDSSNPRLRGVYQIRNLVNGKIYIGSSTKLGYRLYQHLWCLYRGIHNAPHLQKSWNKYGPESFVLEILEVCPAEVDVLEREQWYLDNKKPYDKGVGYNTSKSAVPGSLGATMPRESVERAVASRKGFRHTPESIEKMRLVKTGFRLSSESRKKYSASKGVEPFFAYKVDGTFVGEFCSACQAAETLVMNRHEIGRVLRGEKFVVSGYLFEHVKHGKRSEEEIRARGLKDIRVHQPKPVIATSTDNSTVQEFPSLKNAAKVLGTSYMKILRCMRSGRTFKGYSFSYAMTAEVKKAS